MDTVICRGRTDCTAFGVFIAIVLIIVLLNYIQRRIQSYRSNNNNSNIPLYNANIVPSMPPNTPLTEDTPIYRHALKSMPSAPYNPNAIMGRNATSKEVDKEKESCAICLGEFEKEESVRVLPKCRHVYHEECIDQWLLRALHCPICRMRVVDFQQHHSKILHTNVDIRLSNLNHHHFTPPNLGLV